MNTNEPKPTPIVPDAPEVVTEDDLALAEWNRCMPELARIGLLTRLDRMVFACYCKSWANWLRAERFLMEHGTIYKVVAPFAEGGEEGHIQWKPFPQVIIARNEKAAMKAFGRELGLSPAARGALNMTVSQPADDSDLD